MVQRLYGSDDAIRKRYCESTEGIPPFPPLRSSMRGRPHSRHPYSCPLMAPLGPMAKALQPTSLSFSPAGILETAVTLPS